MQQDHSWHNKIPTMERADYLKVLAVVFGTEEPIEDSLHRLRWLDHLGCMDPDRLPKIFLFGELERQGHVMGQRKDSVTE